MGRNIVIHDWDKDSKWQTLTCVHSARLMIESDGTGARRSLFAISSRMDQNRDCGYYDRGFKRAAINFQIANDFLSGRNAAPRLQLLSDFMFLTSQATSHHAKRPLLPI